MRIDSMIDVVGNVFVLDIRGRYGTGGGVQRRFHLQGVAVHALMTGTALDLGGRNQRRVYSAERHE